MIHGIFESQIQTFLKAEIQQPLVNFCFLLKHYNSKVTLLISSRFGYLNGLIKTLKNKTKRPTLY